MQCEADVLKVPSSIVEQEFNYLINPIHPDAKRIKVKSKRIMTFDQRIRESKKRETDS